jgi:hypothetical protein
LSCGRFSIRRNKKNQTVKMSQVYCAGMTDTDEIQWIGYVYADVRCIITEGYSSMRWYYLGNAPLLAHYAAG